MNRRTYPIIISLGLGAMTVGTDFTGAVMLAVPIEQEYGVDITTTQWVFNVYALVFAMLLVTGGRIADMYGRRRLLLLGLVIFILASLACTLAPSVGILITARAFQGVGTAIVWPCLLGIVSTSVKEDERGYAMGLLIGCVGIGNSVGPIIAGVAGGLGEWRLFFLTNVILGLVTLVTTLKFIPDDAGSDEDRRIDYAGVAVLSLALLSLLYAMDVGADWGWRSLRIAGLFAVSAILFSIFPLIEKRVRGALVPAPMLRNGHFLAALASNGLMVPAVFVFFLYLPQYFQKTLDWSVMHASIGIVPMMICIAVASPIAGRLYDRIGPRRLLLIGYGMVGLGLVGTVVADATPGYLRLIPAMVVLGIGAAVAVSAAGPAAIAAVDASRASLAGALSFMVHLAIGAIGVAGSTAIVFGISSVRFRDELESIGVTLSAADQITLAGSARNTPEALKILDRFPSDTAEKITTAAQHAFSAGFNSALWFCLAFVAVGIVVAFFVTGGRAIEPAAS